MIAHLISFLVRSTGYIGGSILTAILKQYPESTITVQYRQQAHKDILEKFSKQIVPVKGELDRRGFRRRETQCEQREEEDILRLGGL